MQSYLCMLYVSVKVQGRTNTWAHTHVCVKDGNIVGWLPTGQWPVCLDPLFVQLNTDTVKELPRPM